MNLPLVTAFIAIFFTQLIKYPISFLFNKKGAEIDIVTSTGGMPSSHSAAVTSLITALIFEYGFSSPHVAIATIFGVIVMFDSMGVRRQSGEQGIVLDILAKKHLQELNQQVNQYNSTTEETYKENPVLNQYDIEDYEHMIIKKYLGHKPTEVIGGIMTGGIVAFVCRMIFN